MEPVKYHDEPAVTSLDDRHERLTPVKWYWNFIVFIRPSKCFHLSLPSLIIIFRSDPFHFQTQSARVRVLGEINLFPPIHPMHPSVEDNVHVEGRSLVSCLLASRSRVVFAVKKDVKAGIERM